MRTVARFRLHRHRWYARCKLAADPVFAATAAILLQHDERALLDIGCGLGLLGIYLRERGHRGAYRGLDFDAPKIAEARRAAQDLSEFAVEVGDADAGLPEFCGDVALIDVLHYLSADAQVRLLRNAAARVDRDGCLIVRNVLRERHWRFRATALEEWFAHVLHWTPGAAHFPNFEEIAMPLRAAGFSVRARALWGHTPFNSYLIVARRSDPQTQERAPM
ncbi:MAG TPA: class I SAM-dependent methyltransferase [Rhodanobacteraceae bacterium]|nr:class I SAM-dependent methyltransferase [Rhodanobacteraceae bacterium]